MTTKFSITIPAYNVADYLPACLDSVLQQKMADFEVILVDDGSTDSTPQICAEYAAKDPRVHLVHQPNSGLSAARNTGVKHASGEYLLFLDGDDFFTEDALTKISQALNSYSCPVDLLRFQCQDLLADGTLVPRSDAGFAPMSGLKAFPLLARSYYTENAWLYCYRAAFFKSQHFTYAPGRLAEDFGLTPLIIARADSVAAISDICYNYRLRTGSIMHDPAKLRRRVADAYAGLEYQLPLLDALNPKTTAPISHYLCVSFLTLAAQLPQSEFLQSYHQFKTAGFLRYIRPQSLRNIPRSLLLRYSPRLYQRFFRLESSEASVSPESLEIPKTNLS